MHPPHKNSLKERLTSAVLELCAIPSVTQDEQALADHMWRWAQGIPRLSQRARLGHAMVLGAPSNQLPTVALVGHLDTVPPAEQVMQAPYRDGADVVGLGASDMKGGIAVMQILLEDLADQDVSINPMMVLYDREEGPFADNGLEPLLQAYPQLKEVDLAVVMEPTDNTLQLGCVGSLQATVSFAGRAAHTARPWQGDNAIHKAGPLLVSLLGRGHEEVAVEGLIFRQAISATLAKGGRAKNVVPDSFELNINVRFAPGEDAVERAKSELTRLAHGAEIVINDIAPPGPIPQDNPILGHFRRLSGLAVEPKQAWTDVARLAAFGIDAVNFGPGATAQAHQAGERINVDAMVSSYEYLRDLLLASL